MKRELHFLPFLPATLILVILFSIAATGAESDEDLVKKTQNPMSLDLLSSMCLLRGIQAHILGRCGMNNWNVKKRDFEKSA